MIGPKRLQAIPDTELCIECKTKQLGPGATPSFVKHYDTIVHWDSGSVGQSVLSTESLLEGRPDTQFVIQSIKIFDPFNESNISNPIVIERFLNEFYKRSIKLNKIPELKFHNGKLSEWLYEFSS